MADSYNCPECASALPFDAPQGLCPKCLLNRALENPSLEPFDDFSQLLLSAPAVPANGSATSWTSLLREESVYLQTHPRPQVHRLAPIDSNLSGSPSACYRYHLFGEIARGGMGAILRGRDLDLGRDLAIKILLEEHRNDPALVQRFVEEARISGRLQHPGIVPVHELGTFPDDRPYFTMKLVTGQTLAELLAARTKLDDERTRFLSIFEQVCQTMSYAHDRGVIHRDLKPGNVMVGKFGEVQLMDWGLARVLRTASANDPVEQGENPSGPRLDAVIDRSDIASTFGSVVGTVAYMAPEQARGETDLLDERVDVFGLGAILCEILTGRPPYVAHPSGSLRELAAGADLTSAWRRIEDCGADRELVALARRCLAPLPRDRPKNASEVVIYLSSYFRGVQERLKVAEMASVEALARAATERTRRRLAVGLAVALVLLVATLGISGFAIAWNFQRRSAELEQAMRDVMVRKDEAEASSNDPARWATAVEAARRLALLLPNAHDRATRSRATRLVADINEKSQAITIDQKLIEDLDEVRDTLDESPADQIDAAYTAAFRSAGIDVDDQSPEVVAQAIASRPSPVASAEIAAVDRWATIRRARGDHDGAAKLTEIAQAADADPWRGRLRMALSERDRKIRLTALRELASSAVPAELSPVTLSLLGESLFRNGDAAAALTVLHPAQRLHPNDLGLTLTTAQALLELSRRPEAIRYLMMARALRPESSHALAHALAAEQDTDEAIAVLRDLVRRIPAVSRNYSCLGNMLRQRGRIQEAREILDAGIAIGLEATTRHPHDLTAHMVLGNLLGNRGNYEEAASEFLSVIQLRPNDSGAHMNLGIVRRNQGRLTDAVVELREAIRLAPYEHQSHATLATVYQALRQRNDAIVELRETVLLKPDEGEAHYNLGLALFHAGQHSDALAEYRAAIALNLHTAKVHYNVGHILQLQGHVEDSIAEYRIAIELSPDFAEAHCNLGSQLKAKGSYAESLAEYERGHDLGSKRSHWVYPSAQWVEEARCLARADRDLLGAIRGEITPATSTDCHQLANVARARSFHAASARFWAQSFALTPQPANHEIRRLHFIAASSAALAGCGKGNDAPVLDHVALAELRRQAHEWLAADLVKAENPVESRNSANTKSLLELIREWKSAPDLAGIRDSDKLTKLPQNEQTEWRKLWHQVDCLLNPSPKSENHK